MTKRLFIISIALLIVTIYLSNSNDNGAKYSNISISEKMAIIDDRKFPPSQYAEALKDIQKLNPDLSLEEIGDVLAFVYNKSKAIHPNLSFYEIIHAVEEMNHQLYKKPERDKNQLKMAAALVAVSYEK